MIPEPVKAEQELVPYHNGKKTRGVPATERKFIVWDGEGINLHGVGKPQSYVLFGNNHDHISSKTGLTTFQCLEFIIETGLRYPNSYHVGFAFTYDSNMIIKDLSPTTLARLHRQGWVQVKRKDGTRYNITFIPGKMIRITKLKPEYDRKKNPTAKITICIEDVFSFFAKSFVDAYEQMIGQVSSTVVEGKAQRKNFSLDEWDFMVNYWKSEIQELHLLVEELRKRVYDAGLFITKWYGPGSLASYAMKQHHIKEHMEVAPDEVRLAARYAYAGGRFELYKIGRIHGTIYGYDINSAYPAAIALLPSLRNGTWRYVERPRSLVRFGVYRISLHPKRLPVFIHTISPLFHRDKQHNITFPWTVDGWYWSPEAREAVLAGATVLEGWEFIPDDDKRPFAYVADMYHQRQLWKAEGVAAELALKLCMNSKYGKLAQRVGWDEQRQQIPSLHQLEWAGWITSYTRAKLYQMMKRVPFEHLIAVETDGFYTTLTPDEMGITEGDTLGSWSIDQYTEVQYIQSGLAWLHSEKKGWQAKRRGLDKDTFAQSVCEDYLRQLHPKPHGDRPWPKFTGRTTRFVGLGKALSSRVPLLHHCVWDTEPRDINTGQQGKRIHVHTHCRACQLGLNAYDMAHDLVIHSMAMVDPNSYPHDIPWETSNDERDDGPAEWRNYQDA